MEHGKPRYVAMSDIGYITPEHSAIFDSKPIRTDIYEGAEFLGYLESVNPQNLFLEKTYYALKYTSSEYSGQREFDKYRQSLHRSYDFMLDDLMSNIYTSLTRRQKEEVSPKIYGDQIATIKERFATIKERLVTYYFNLPVTEFKTRWYITICHNYYISDFGKQLMRTLASTIVGQDRIQMNKQSKENILKKTLLFRHIFPNEEPILWLHSKFKDYIYPSIQECEDFVKRFGI